jgi:hypothetical protein
MSYEKNSEEPEKIPPRWTPTETLDSGADVILAFHGLMCLCKHNNGFCEVGILNTDKGKHDLRIYIFEVDTGFNPPANLRFQEIRRIFPVITADETGDEFTDIVDIRVFRPRPGFNGVKFFMPRGTPLTDRNDFRFITDLEGKGFYEGRKVGKDHEAFGPRLHISDGVFYTMCKTRGTFDLDEGGTKLDTRSIALLVGANIYLDKSRPNPGTVELRINQQQPITLPSAEGKKNFVLIDNSCPGHLCDTINGDFHLYFDAVTPPDGREEIKLRHASGMGSGPTEGPCDPNFLEDLNKLVAEFPVKRFGDISDDSPCGAAGAGSSGTLGPGS